MISLCVEKIFRYIQFLHENVTYRKRRTYLYLQGTQVYLPVLHELTGLT